MSQQPGLDQNIGIGDNDAYKGNIRDNVKASNQSVIDRFVFHTTPHQGHIGSTPIMHKDYFEMYVFVVNDGTLNIVVSILSQ